MSRQCAYKLLDFRASDGAVPTFCLNIDRIKPELILFDNAINAIVPRPPNCFPSILARAAIAHFDEPFDNKPLEKGWRTIFQSLEQIER